MLHICVGRAGNLRQVRRRVATHSKTICLAIRSFGDEAHTCRMCVARNNSHINKDNPTASQFKSTKPFNQTVRDMFQFARPTSATRWPHTVLAVWNANHANGKRLSHALVSFTSALAFSLIVFSSGAFANSKIEMQGLDEQVQEIKSDVLGIAEELRRLEEKLLFLSNTQVAVFVSMPSGIGFRLDSVKLQIDGKPAARHIYSFKELDALKKGGVQRLYTGNVATGAHQLQIEVAGQSKTGAQVLSSEAISFDKAAEPKLIEFSLAGGDVGGVRIELSGTAP